MVLMKPGVWHDTVWADRTWPEDLWLEYGTAVVGGDSARYYYMLPQPRPKRRKELFLALIELLKALKGE